MTVYNLPLFQLLFCNYIPLKAIELDERLCDLLKAAFSTANQVNSTSTNCSIQLLLTTRLQYLQQSLAIYTRWFRWHWSEIYCLIWNSISVNENSRQIYIDQYLYFHYSVDVVNIWDSRSWFCYKSSEQRTFELSKAGNQTHGFC